MSNDRLAELYRAYGPQIYARCRHLLADAAAAEDAMQETFIRVSRHLDQTPNAREALAWIYRIATNYCLNEIRNRKIRPIATEELPERSDGGMDQILEDRDLAGRIIQRSPEKFRTIAWLHYVDGMKQEEVAEALKISRRTVQNRLMTFAKNARKFLGRA